MDEKEHEKEMVKPLSEPQRSNREDRRNLVITIPVFNDWAALEKLLWILDRISLPEDIDLKVLVVDDFSSQDIPDTFLNQAYRKIKQVNILRVLRNLGHQRSIVVGLCYAYENLDCDLVAVMDGDGEDNPFEIERLLNISEKTDNRTIVFAKRSKRSESQTFKLFYFLYQQLFRMLTGSQIRVGNFSLLPGFVLKNVVVISEIWNHYSSGLHRSRIPYLEVNVARTKRLDGKPKMNLVSLITHGLSSIAVYGDLVGTRILITTALLSIVLLLALCLVVAIRLLTDLAIPGWTTYMFGLLIVSLLQLILIGTVFSLIILAARNSVNIIPIRDYKYYVDHCFTLKP